ncbi:hypothetical protein BKA82DRAFT_4131576 [Pisolithus tinctorius]|nr:hypothetical protein BKA82DRAFT_4131576 [Pisolithus tinctorius]
MTQILALCVLLVLSLCLSTALIYHACAQQIVVLSSNDPDIIYNPPLFFFRCRFWLYQPVSSIVNVRLHLKQLLNHSSVSTTVISTNGPIPQAGNVIFQMFLTFRASSLCLYPSPVSNATVNLTLAAELSDTSITSMVNTSINIITAVGLPQTQATTLGITFILGDLPTRFDVESITLVVANARHVVFCVLLVNTTCNHLFVLFIRATASYLPS